jgi:hypothetical protein
MSVRAPGSPLLSGPVEKPALREAGCSTAPFLFRSSLKKEYSLPAAHPRDCELLPSAKLSIAEVVRGTVSRVFELDVEADFI